MRILTLGVLICAGGTLAALPFRRYQAIPDASSSPIQVTGPMKGVLDQTAIGPDRAPSFAIESNIPGQSVGHVFQQPPRSQPLGFEVEPRRADIPLTFEDLQVPIDMPEPIKQRFNAVAPIRAEQLQRERIAGMVMPDLETLADSQRQQLDSVAARFAEVTDVAVEPAQTMAEWMPRSADASDRNMARATAPGREAVGKVAAAKVAGALASSRDANVELLPRPAGSERQRHWIRQPD